jgi:hypothetical protein
LLAEVEVVHPVLQDARTQAEAQRAEVEAAIVVVGAGAAVVVVVPRGKTFFPERIQKQKR